MNKIKRRILIIAIIFLSIYLFYKIDSDLKPVLLAYCDSEARIVATTTINETIKNEFQNKISYDDIVSTKLDNEGNIIMLQANTVELNRIGSEIALAVQNRIQSKGTTGVKIPLGVLLKNDLFAYYGPKITFKMQPLGSVTTTYRSDFQSAGINQTRHVIYLDVTANVFVVIPLANNITVTSSVPIAESIIVGKVPGTFVTLPNGTK